MAHTLLTAIYHVLNNPGLEFQDLGENFFDKRDAQLTASRLVRRLEKLGYQFGIAPKTV